MDKRRGIFKTLQALVGAVHRRASPLLLRRNALFPPLGRGIDTPGNPA